MSKKSRQQSLELMKVAAVERKNDVFLSQLEMINNRLNQDKELREFIDSSDVTPADKKAKLLEIFGEQTQDLLNTLFSITSSKREVHAELNLIHDFIEYRYKIEGYLLGEVYSVRPLDKQDLAKIEEALSEKIGIKVKVENRIDEEMIGGIRFELGDYVLDGSYNTILNRLKEELLADQEIRNAENTAEAIKKKLEFYQPSAELEEQTADDYGYITTVADGIIRISGLKKAMAGELLKINDASAMVMNLEEDEVAAALLQDSEDIVEGSQVRTTKSVVTVPVGDGLIGRVVDALGNPIDGFGEIVADDYFPIERPAPGVIERQSVNEPLETGLKVIDSMIPIGRGQRELIIGDRQTGKTAIAIDTILNQKGKNVKCIYVAIGQKNSYVAQLVDRLKQAGAMEYTTIVLSSAADLPAVQYIAPYSGCAIGEYWMQKGEDVLIVYDDLSKHAVAYRTLSLLLRRPPGREAYPGDVFYLHSRLLERSAKLSDELGGGSMTALPIVETLSGDISAYIPTNVISITDGQIFLQTEMFNSGNRPAVDSGLSVSRVGSSAQTKAMKKVSSSLKLELAQYQEVLDFAQFGSDIDSSTKKTINHGQHLMALLKQPQYSPVSSEKQVIILLAAQKGLLEKVPLEKMSEYENK